MATDCKHSRSAPALRVVDAYLTPPDHAVSMAECWCQWQTALNIEVDRGRRRVSSE